MRVGWMGLALALGSTLTSQVVHAADPASVQAPIKGVDVMGDKGRSGPDGIAWAPVTKDQAASGTAAGENKGSVQATPNAQPVAASGKTLPPGQDPGTPAVAQSHGPGVLDQTSNSGKP